MYRYISNYWVNKTEFQSSIRSENLNISIIYSFFFQMNPYALRLLELSLIKSFQYEKSMHKYDLVPIIKERWDKKGSSDLMPIIAMTSIFTASNFILSYLTRARFFFLLLVFFAHRSPFLSVALYCID